MYDSGDTSTMQSKNGISDTPWIDEKDYIAAGGSEEDFNGVGANDKGPLTALSAINMATNCWYVNIQTYQLGTTKFAQDSYYTSCDGSRCWENFYSLSKITARARLIAWQEVLDLGGILNPSDEYDWNFSGPQWLQGAYWTASAYWNPDYPDNYISGLALDGPNDAAASSKVRAVVVVSK